MSSMRHDPEKPLIASAPDVAPKRDAAAERSLADYEGPVGIASSKSISSSDAPGAVPRISIDRRLADAGRSADARVPDSLIASARGSG